MNWQQVQQPHLYGPYNSNTILHLRKRGSRNFVSAISLRRQHASCAGRLLHGVDKAQQLSNDRPFGRRRCHRMPACTSSLRAPAGTESEAQGGRACSICRRSHSPDVSSSSIQNHGLAGTWEWRRRTERCSRSMQTWQPLDRRKHPRCCCLSDAASSASSMSSEPEGEDGTHPGLSPKWTPGQVTKHTSTL